MRISMTTKLIERAAVAIGLAGALAAVVIALDRSDRPVKPPQQPAGAIDAELEQCASMGLAALDDPLCKAIWGSSVDRFYQMQRHEEPKTNPCSPTLPPSITGPSR
jgi:conjugative transfer region protein TrbK